MRPTNRIARLTSLIAAVAVVFAALLVAHPRGWTVSAFAAAAAQQQALQRATPLSFDVQFPAAALGKPYTPSMRASGGVGGYTFAEGGTLPPGMQWVPAGEGLLLRGTPTQAGDYTIQIIVNDSLGQQITKDAIFHVTPYDTGATVPVTLTETITTTDTESFTSANPIALSPSTIPGGQAGSVYAGATFMATGGLGTPTVTSSGNIPTGMTLTQGSAKLVLAGTPLSGGTFPLTVTATDSAGNAVSKNYNLVIAAAPPIVITPTTIPGAQQYVLYAAVTVSASGGAGTLTLSSSSTLPSGINFIQNNVSTVVFTGTPTQTGTFPIVVNATDQGGNTASVTYTLNVGPAPPFYITTNPAFQQYATVGVPYPLVQFLGAGGSGSSTISFIGLAPPGMTLVAGGQNSYVDLFGTPTKAGEYSFDITAKDLAGGPTLGQYYELYISLPSYNITPSYFPLAYGSQPYSQTFSIVGNPAGYTLTMGNVAGLPAGLTYSASGESVTIAGILPNTTSHMTYGPFPFYLTDQNGNVQTITTSWDVYPSPVATIGITTTPSSPLYTDQITLNFAATGNYASPTGAVTPTGTITGTLDGTARSINLTLVNGQATLPVGRLAPGTHTVTYSYSGDSVYPGTGSTVAGAPAVSTATATFTVAYPPYSLAGTAFEVASGVGYFDAIDSSDNVYISDSNNNVIRKYDTSGNLTVVPTTGLNKPGGIVFDGSGNLYIADYGNNRIVELAPNGTQTVLPVPTLSPPLNAPYALAFDPSYQNLWIVEYGNNRLVDYNLANQSAITAGFPAAMDSVAVAPNGTVYAGALLCGGVYTYTPGSGSVTQLSLPQSQVCGANSLAFDRSGNLYIDDNHYGSIYLMDASGNLTRLMSTVASQFAVDSQSNLWPIDYNLTEFVQGPASFAGNSKSPGGSQGYGGDFTMYFHSPTGITLSSVTVPANSGYNGGGAQIIYGASNFASSDLEKTPIHPGQQNSSATATFSDGTVLKVPIYGSDYNTELGISPGTVSQVTTSWARRSSPRTAAAASASPATTRAPLRRPRSTWWARAATPGRGNR